MLPIIINYFRDLILPDRFVVLLCSLSDALRLNLGSVIDKKCLKLQTFRQQKIPNVVPSDCDMIKSDGFSALHSQLNCLEMSVHRDIDTYKENET